MFVLTSEYPMLCSLYVFIANNTKFIINEIKATVS